MGRFNYKPDQLNAWVVNSQNFLSKFVRFVRFKPGSEKTYNKRNKVIKFAMQKMHKAV